MRSIRNCSVAVVGGAGFLGSHLVNHLIDDRKCRVLVVDNLVAGRREFVHKDAQFVHHDITGSEERLLKIFEAFSDPDVPSIARPDFYVLNFAAYPYVPDSYSRPIHVNDVNFMGAMKVINAAQEAGADGILQVGSAEVFGDQSGSIDEDGLLTPHSSYGVSKAAIDMWCQVRWHESKTPVMVLRQFNCYGPRPLHPYVIPEIIQQLHHNGPRLRLGNNSERDFQYAGDAVAMATRLLECGEFGSIYNMGSEVSIKIYDLAQLIGRIMGHNEVTIEQDPARVRPWEIWSLKSSNKKLYSTIDVRPKVSFEDGLSETIKDYRRLGHWVF